MHRTVLTLGFSVGIFAGLQVSTQADAQARPDQVPGASRASSDIGCEIIVDGGHMMLLADSNGHLGTVNRFGRLSAIGSDVRRVMVWNAIPLHPIEGGTRIFASPKSRLAPDIQWAIQYQAYDFELSAGNATYTCTRRLLGFNQSVEGPTDGLGFGSCPDCVVESVCFCMEDLYDVEVNFGFCSELNAAPASCSGATWLLDEEDAEEQDS